MIHQLFRLQDEHIIYHCNTQLTCIINSPTVRYAENISKSTPKIIPVKLIANGRDNAPAPNVALHKFDIEPAFILLHRLRHEL